jgi:hypothetical protein
VSIRNREARVEEVMESRLSSREPREGGDRRGYALGATKWGLDSMSLGCQLDFGH